MKLCLPQAFFFVVFTSPALATRRSSVKHSSHGLQHVRINPKLDPESDKVFFGHDYPDNLAAKGHVKPEFGHPYPVIQDTDKFDKDYVKDENGDDGEWEAQMGYDLVRTKVSKAKDDMEKAKAAKEEQQERLREARKKQADAEKEAGVVNEKVAKARAETKSAEKDANDAKEATEKAEEEDVDDMRKAVEAEGKNGNAGKTGETGETAEGDETSETGTKDGKKSSSEAAKSGKNNKEMSSEEKVEAATKTVKKEMADLDKCQKELEKARTKLKELAEKEGKLAKTKREEHEQKVAKLEKEKAELSNEQAQASEEVSKNEKDAAGLEKEKAAGQEKLSEEEKRHEAAAAKAKLESTDLEKLESDMKVAEQNLRKLRRAEDADGGVYNEKKTKPCTKSTDKLPAQEQNCEKSGAMGRNACAATMTFFAAAMMMMSAL